MLIGGRGLRRIGKRDLALERRVQQILIALNLHIADEVRIDHDNAWNIRKTRHRPLGVLERGLNVILVHRSIVLKECRLRLHRIE